MILIDSCDTFARPSYHPIVPSLSFSLLLLSYSSIQSDSTSLAEIGEMHPSIIPSTSAGASAVPAVPRRATCRHIPDARRNLHGRGDVFG